VQLIFPILYGVYLSLCLLILQPLQSDGLSPLGGLCLVVMGYGGVGIVSALVSFPGWSGLFYLPRLTMKSVFGASLLHVLGIGAFITGIMAGSSFLFAVLSLLYGQVAGTVWYRFRTGQGFPVFVRLAIAFASVAVAVVYLFDWAGLGSGFVLAGDRQWALRALVLLGAMIFGLSQTWFVPREQPVARSKWLFWESVLTVLVVSLFAGFVQAVALGHDVVGAGFAAEPLLGVPFVLLGMVLGGLKHRLVHAWEPTVGSGLLTSLWVSALVTTAVLSLVLLQIGVDAAGWPMPGGGLPTIRAGVAGELFALLVVSLVVVLIRNAQAPVADYGGPRALSSIGAKG
jgi:hypothetical protein